MHKQAEECLKDVISHKADIIGAYGRLQALAIAVHDHDSATYWKHQIAVIERMSGQAEVALKESETDTWVDDDGTTWVQPTAWAYAQVCRANNAKTDALREIDAYTLDFHLGNMHKIELVNRIRKIVERLISVPTHI